MAKIMIVDDEQDFIDLCERLLNREGYDVITATSGQECLEKLKTQHPDLILMDFFMPKMDGRMVIEKIRENPNLAHTKIAFLTIATFRERGKEIMKELEVIDYIMKPIKPKHLIVPIKRSLKKI